MTDAERMRRYRERIKTRAEPAAPTNGQISIQLDPDVLAKLCEAGPGWQSRINALLRQALHLEA